MICVRFLCAPDPFRIQGGYDELLDDSEDEDDVGNRRVKPRKVNLFRQRLRSLPRRSPSHNIE